MKVCTDCHSEVEPGWQYCHTCGAVAMSTVYRIGEAIAGTSAPGPTEPSSPFMALLEGRPTAPEDQEYLGESSAVAGESSAAAAAASLTSALPLTPNVLPQSVPATRAQKTVVTGLLIALLALGYVTAQLRSDLSETRARLQRTQGELDSARTGEPGK